MDLVAASGGRRAELELDAYSWADTTARDVLRVDGHVVRDLLAVCPVRGAVSCCSTDTLHPARCTAELGGGALRREAVAARFLPSAADAGRLRSEHRSPFA